MSPHYSGHFYFFDVISDKAHSIDILKKKYQHLTAFLSIKFLYWFNIFIEKAIHVVHNNYLNTETCFDTVLMYCTLNMAANLATTIKAFLPVLRF